MRKTLQQLQDELAQVEARIARHQIACERWSGFNTNPAGDIGGIRSRSRKQKEQLFNRWTKQANETVYLAGRKAALEREIAAVQEADRRALYADRIAMERLKRWEAIAPGDALDVGGNSPLTVARKSRFSLVTVGGSRWTIEEVVGLERARVEDVWAMLRAEARAVLEKEKEGADGRSTEAE